MRISLFGVGYVGSVSAACLARDGHTVVAVDPNPEKLALINAGRAPIVEPGVEALIQSAVAAGRLRSAPDAETAVAESDLSILCVGTPSHPEGGLDTRMVEAAAASIGAALARKADRHTVVIRSTLLPGAMTTRIIPALEATSGLRAGAGFGVAYLPEFLREGSAVADYDDPSVVIAAVSDPETLAVLNQILPAQAPAPIVIAFAEAEAAKGVRNIINAVNVSFANEVGGLLAAIGVDSHRVMSAVGQERRSGRRAAYLTPGFAYGGSCLPKDLRAFAALGASMQRPTPLLSAAAQVNDGVIEQAVALVEAAGGRRVSIIGLSFKEGTDDLRESPALILAERLIARGFDVRMFDPNVRHHSLSGANLLYAAERLPQIRGLLCDDIGVAVRHGETLVLAHAAPGAEAMALSPLDTRIVDLVRVGPELRSEGRYAGLFW